MLWFVARARGGGVLQGSRAGFTFGKSCLLATDAKRLLDRPSIVAELGHGGL